MNEIEKDIINNNLDENFVERYQRIESRMLESEKARMERKQKEERESRTADELDMRYNRALEEYLKQKEIFNESLRWSPIYLSPFYKKRVNTTPWFSL